MTEEKSEPLMSDHEKPQPYMGFPSQGYTSQPNYLPPPQQGHVFTGQPVHQGYVVQGPPAYGAQDYNAPMAVMTVLPPPPVKDYMVAAIVVTLCCFFPTGILAVMRASDAKSAAAYGDIQTAERHADSAKKMINISIIAGIVCTIVMVALLVVYFMLIAQAAKSAYGGHYNK